MTTQTALTMRPLTEGPATGLQWVQPAVLKPHHELRAGDQTVAVLDFERATLATGQTEVGTWTFKREGFWHPHVTVRPQGSEQNVAVFTPAWAGGGRLETADGHVYELGLTGFWHTEWQWRQRDEVLVRFRRPAGLFKSVALVDVAPGAQRLPDLSLLVLLGWYLMVLFAQDMAVATAAVAATH